MRETLIFIAIVGAVFALGYQLSDSGGKQAAKRLSAEVENAVRCKETCSNYPGADRWATGRIGSNQNCVCSGPVK